MMEFLGRELKENQEPKVYILETMANGLCTLISSLDYSDLCDYLARPAKDRQIQRNIAIVGTADRINGDVDKFIKFAEDLNFKLTEHQGSVVLNLSDMPTDMLLAKMHLRRTWNNIVYEFSQTLEKLKTRPKYFNPTSIQKSRGKRKQKRY